MATLLILAMLGILYLLLVFPWPMPLSYRLFLGLIITWPILELYLVVDLPAGIPDLHYHRGYIALLLGIAFMSLVLTQRRGRLTAESELPGKGLLASADANSQLLVADASGGYAGSPMAEPSLPAASSVSASSKRPSGTSQAAQETYQRPLRWLPFTVRVYIVLMGIAVINGLALGYSDSTRVAGYVDLTLIPVAAYCLTKMSIVSRQRLVWLFGAIIAAAVIVCFTGLYERVFELTESAYPISSHNEKGGTRYLDVPGGRATGVVGSPAVFGGIMGLGLLCTLACLVHATKTSSKWLLGCVALLLAYGVVVTFTRAAWISVGVALLFAQFYFKGMWKVTLPLVLAGGCLLAIMWASLQSNEILQDRVLDSENITGRVDRFLWSAERFMERPILGHGPGGLNIRMRQVFPEGFNVSHNTYMTMLVDNGLIVFVCFWVVVLGWLAKAKSVLASRGKYQFERSAVAAVVGFLAIWLMCGMSLELTFIPYYTALFWIAGAVIERMTDVCVANNNESAVGIVAHAES